MAGNQVITVKEADGVTLTDVEVLGTGRQAVAASKSVGWANEDQAAIGIVTETAPAGDTASSGLNGRLQRLAQRISSLIGLFPNTLGASGGMKVEIVAGAGSGGTAQPDGGTFTAGTTQGTPSGGFYQTTVTSNPLTTGKFGWSQMTPFRALHVDLRDALGNELVMAASSGPPAATVPAIPVTIRDVNVNGSALSASSAPVVIASDQAPISVLPYGATANFVSGAISAAMTATTTTSLLAAPGAGLRNYVTTIIVSNSHATVGTDILIQDGSGGTTLLVIPAAAVYGGAAITLPTPLRQPTTNTALFCANATTGSSTKVSAVGYKAA
jgi:hypothetical protein